MKREERRQAIMDLLVEKRAVELDDLAERFAVSKMTIHRDLDDLEAEGVLRKVRGGATIEAGTQFESDFRIRARQDGEAKARMARAALELVEPGMTVMINDGSMAALLGSALVDKRPLTVITNNAAVIDDLKDEPGITLIALGGGLQRQVQRLFRGGDGTCPGAAAGRSGFHLGPGGVGAAGFPHGRCHCAYQAGDDGGGDAVLPADQPCPVRADGAACAVGPDRFRHHHHR